jgi:protein SCO1/2
MFIKILPSVFLLYTLPLLAQNHAATGVVIQANPETHTLVVSCSEIPGYMAAMEMPFKVRAVHALLALKPGMQIHFDIVTADHSLYADHITVQAPENFESESMQAGSLTALSSAVHSTATAKPVKVGEPVPDFALTDQSGNEIHLSQFRDKVVVLTFGYSRCPNPDYCLRLSNNLSAVERRFKDHAGRDLILLTIAIDPEHDRGETLATYAEAFQADPQKWHFLTGSVAEVHQVANLFGMNFWREDGLLTHSLHTVMINGKGELSTNLEGNRFTAQQLGDLVEAQLNTP